MEILAKDPAYLVIFTKPVPREDIASISASANKYGSGPKGNEDEIYQVYCDQLDQLRAMSLDQLVLLQSELNVSGGASIFILLKNGQKINLCVDLWPRLAVRRPFSRAHTPSARGHAAAVVPIWVTVSRSFRRQR